MPFLISWITAGGHETEKAGMCKKWQEHIEMLSPLMLPTTLKAMICGWPQYCLMYNRLLWETTDCDVTFITLSYDERTKTVTLPWVWNLHYMISHSTVAPQCGFSWQLIIHHAVIHHGSWITALNLVSHSNWSCISYNCDWKWITALNLVSHSNWSYITQSHDPAQVDCNV